MIEYEIHIEQTKKAYINIEAESEEEAVEKAREIFHTMLIDGSADDEEINIIGVDWEEDDAD